MPSVPFGLITARDWVGDQTVTAVNGELFRMYVRDINFVSIEIGAMAGQALPGAGAVTYEASNDGLTNWFPVPYVSQAGVLTASGVQVLTAAALVYIATPFNWLRGRVSTLITTPPAGPYVWTLGEEEASLSSIFGGQSAPSFFATFVAGSRVAVDAAAVAGGSLIHRLLTAAASDNPTLIAAGAHRLYDIELYNAAATIKYLKVYNKATAPSNADTPVLTYVLPATSRFTKAFESLGASFSLGLGYRITGALADADNTALVAADIQGLNILYG